MSYFNKGVWDKLAAMARAKRAQAFDREPFAPPAGVGPNFDAVADDAQRIFRSQMDGNLSGQETRVLLTNLAESVGGTYEEIAEWMFGAKNAQMDKEFDPLAPQPRGTVPRPEWRSEEGWNERSSYGQLDLLTYDHDWQDVCDAADEVYSHPDFPENHDKYPPLPADMPATNGVDMWTFEHDTNDYPAYVCVYHGSPEDVAARLNALRTIDEAKAHYNQPTPDVAAPPEEPKQAQLQSTHPIFTDDPDVQDINESEYLDQVEPQDQLEPGMRIEEGPMPNAPRVMRVTPKGEGKEYIEGDIVTVPSEFEVTFGQPEYGGYGTYEATRTDLYQLERYEGGATGWDPNVPLQTIYTIGAFIGSDAKKGWDMWLDKHNGPSGRRPYDGEIWDELTGIWEAYMEHEKADEAAIYG